MDDIKPKKRNVKPEESSNLPMITLGVLVFLVVALLYTGYEYITNDTSSAEELTNVVPSYIESDEEEIDEPIAEELASSESVATVIAKPEAKKKEAVATTEKVDLAKVGGVDRKHTVQAGETFYGIANKYNLSVATLKALNPTIKESDLKSGTTKLNVKIQAVHTVGPGDVLRVVASKYGVTKEQIMQANGKTKDFAQRGEKLIIPLKEKK